jgi:poly(3-hydroxybutyrate) depolymerase
MKIEIVEKHAIMLHIPSNAKEKKTLIVFLHGSGKRTDIEK